MSEAGDLEKSQAQANDEVGELTIGTMAWTAVLGVLFGGVFLAIMWALVKHSALAGAITKKPPWYTLSAIVAAPTLLYLWYRRDRLKRVEQKQKDKELGQKDLDQAVLLFTAGEGGVRGTVAADQQKALYDLERCVELSEGHRQLVAEVVAGAQNTHRTRAGVKPNTDPFISAALALLARLETKYGVTPRTTVDTQHYNDPDTPKQLRQVCTDYANSRKLKAEFQVLREASDTNLGKYSWQFDTEDNMTWGSMVELCKNNKVPHPLNMAADNHPNFIRIRFFWDFESDEQPRGSGGET